MEAQIQFFESERFRVRGYLDANDTAWLGIRDVAYGLGLARETKISATSGHKSYKSIRWERVNQYIAEIQERVESELIKSIPVPVDRNGFIPEQLVYRLAMKVNNDIAAKFQSWLADEVIPSIRRTGKYVLPSVAILPAVEKKEPALKGLPPFLTDSYRVCVYVVLLSDNTVKIGKTNDFRRRVLEIRKRKNVDILDSYHTGYLPSLIADDIEKTCHRTFATYRTQGEYFKISFEEACAEVSERARTIIETNRVLYGDKWIDANEECDKFLAEIPVREADAASELSLEKKIDVLLECSKITNTNELRDDILREILFLSTGKKF